MEPKRPAQPEQMRTQPMSAEQVYQEYENIIKNEPAIFQVSPSYQRQLDNWKPTICPTDIPGTNLKPRMSEVEVLKVKGCTGKG